MITEVALITISCVLFVQMGLCGAIERVLRIRFTILSCPKCLTMWGCFFYLIFNKHGLVLSLATSFLASYCALWLALIYDSLALLYNFIYEQINNPQDTAPDAERPESPADTQAGGDAVS